MRPRVQEQGEWVVPTAELSSCSRLTEAETFGRLAVVETHRRGTETARTVCAVNDGAEWLQGIIDLPRPDAVRILDVPPALSSVVQTGHAVYGEGTVACTHWLARPRRTLQHGDPGEVLQALQRLAVVVKRRGKSQAMATGQESLGSLEKRREMLVWAWCHARGDPIGSGTVERANKLVVERWLKGAGMPWARRPGSPMVALRAMACRDRWAEAWPQMAQHVRHQTQQARRQRQPARGPAKAPLPVTFPPLVPPAILPRPNGATTVCPAAVPTAHAHDAQGRERSLSPAVRPPVAMRAQQPEESAAHQHRDLRKTLTHTQFVLAS